MGQEDFILLSEYITSLNTLLPTYYSILDSMVEKQDEQVINLKLPQKISSLSDLGELNKHLTTMFKAFQVDGPFEFEAFDCGTNWYVMKAVGIGTYAFFIACLKIARDYFDTKKSYYDSKTAKLDYEAGLQNGKSSNKEDLEKYTDARLKLSVSDEIQRAVDQIGPINGSSSENLHTRLVIATNLLIKELDDGTEFHLSLNPPAYALEEGGSLTIDYKSIPKELTKPKEIADKGKTATEIESL